MFNLVNTCLTIVTESSLTIYTRQVLGRHAHRGAVVPHIAALDVTEALSVCVLLIVAALGFTWILNLIHPAEIPTPPHPVSLIFSFLSFFIAASIC